MITIQSSCLPYPQLHLEKTVFSGYVHCFAHDGWNFTGYLDLQTSSLVTGYRGLYNW